MECAHCGQATRGLDDPVCQECRSRVATALASAPRLYVRASAELGTQQQALSERVSASAPGSRSPVRDDLLEACDALSRALAAWELATLPQVRHPARAGYVVQRASDTLLDNLDAALTVWRGAGHAARIVAYVKHLRSAIGETHLVHQLAAPCPRCDTRALVRDDGADRVRCRMCHAEWPESRYALLVRALVADRDDTVA